jgi:hypothetical protein
VRVSFSKILILYQSQASPKKLNIKWQFVSEIKEAPKLKFGLKCGEKKFPKN